MINVLNGLFHSIRDKLNIEEFIESLLSLIIKVFPDILQLKYSDTLLLGML